MISLSYHALSFGSVLPQMQANFCAERQIQQLQLARYFSVKCQSDLDIAALHTVVIYA